jgi:hypothetical protein
MTMFDQIYMCEKLAVTRIEEWQRAAQQQRLSAQAGSRRGEQPQSTTELSHWDAGILKFRRLLTRSKGAI